MTWFIILHRKIIEWQWYQDWNTMRLFIHLLLKANHKTWFWQGTEVKRWQHITGRKILSKDLWLTEQQVRTSLKKLEKSWNITSKTTNKNSIIEIINYNDYQQDNQQITNKQPTDNQQVTTNNNNNKDNNNNNKISSEITVATKVATLNLESVIKKNINLKYFIDNYNSNQDYITKQLKEFYLYRSEKKINWKKERWEMEKTFDVSRRFHKWLKNANNYERPKTEDEERKQKLEEIERKKVNLFNNL